MSASLGIEGAAASYQAAAAGSEYRELLDALPDPVLVSSHLGKLLYANRAALEVLGYDEDALLKRSILALHPPAMRGEAVAHLNVATKGDPALCTLPLLRRDGREIPVETRIVAGAWLGRPALISASRVRPDPCEALAAPRETESRYRAILNAFPHLIFVTDAAGIILDFHGADHDDLLAAPEQFLGRHFTQFLPGELARAFEEHCRRAVRSRAKEMLEYRLSVAGEVRHFEALLIPYLPDRVLIVVQDITQRKLAEEELQHSRQQFVTVLDSIDAAVYVADMETHELLFVNKKLQDLIAEARPGRLCWQTLQVGQTGPCDFCTNRYLKTPEGQPEPPFTWEHFNPRSERWLQCRDRAIPWLDGRLVRLEIATDITARKKMEEDLRYRVDFENLVTSLSMRFIHQGSQSIDPEIERALALVGVFTGVDRSYVFLFDKHRRRMSNTHEWCAEGVSPEKSRLQDLDTALMPWWMEQLERLESIHIPRVCDMPPEAESERVVLELQGIQSLVVVPLLACGRLVGFLGFDAVGSTRAWSVEEVRLLRMVGDIFAGALERQRITRALSSSETRHRSLLSAIPDLMFRLDRAGGILDFASGHQQSRAWCREDLLGRRIDCFLAPESMPRLLESMERMLAGQAAEPLECAWDFGQGPETHEVRLSIGGPDEMIAIVRNVNERARLERMRRDFINDASHELRTPLTTIIMVADLLESGGDPADVAEYWRVLKGELSRARLLIEDLLTLGRLESGRLSLPTQPLDLTPIVEQALGGMRPMAKSRSIRLRLERPSRLPPVLANAGGLEQVFANLLSNAIKFTPAHGQVTVSIEIGDADLGVEIRDTGIGIPDAEIDQLFTRFFRASNALAQEIPGSGVGLYIIKAILEELGGSIRIRSVVGEGSVFSLRLPRPREPAPGAGLKRRASPSPFGPRSA